MANFKAIQEPVLKLHAIHEHTVQCAVYNVVSPSYAHFTLADPMPRLCPDAVSSANVNGLPTRIRLSGPHREVIGQYKHV